MENFSFTSLLHKIRHKGTAPEPLNMTHPYRDWKRLLVLFVIVVLTFALWSGYMFWEITRGEFLLEETPSSASLTLESIDTALFEEAVSFFKARERSYETLFDTAPIYHDPR